MYESIALMACICILHNICAHTIVSIVMILNSLFVSFLLCSISFCVIFLAVSHSLLPLSLLLLLLLLRSVAVAVAFFLCWAPFHAQRLMAVYGKVFSPKSRIFMQTYTVLTYVSGVLYFMSTCINPLLYSIMSLKFRNAFKVIKNSNVNYN